MKMYQQRQRSIGWVLLILPTFLLLTTGFSPRLHTTIHGRRSSHTFVEASVSKRDDPTFLFLQEILTQESCKDIAIEVADRISLPFSCPAPVVTLATTLVVEAIASKLSKDLVHQIGDLISLEEASEEKLEELAQEMAVELNPHLDIPVLDEDQEEVVLKEISKAVLNVLVSSEDIAVDPKDLVDKSVSTMQTLLGEEAGRRQLAQLLTAKFDFPFMDEPEEEELLVLALDACADRLLEVMPPRLIDILKGQGSEGLETTKQYIVERVNRGVDILGLTEGQEAWLLENLVSTVLDVLIGDTEAELLLMNPGEQRTKLLQRQAALQRDLRLCQRRLEQEKVFYEGQLERINKRLQTMDE
jgi:hypothetical protein